MNKKIRVREKRWVLFQIENGTYYMGVITQKNETKITIIGNRNITKTFKIKNISINEYKENIYIILVNEITKKYPELDAKITFVIETIKKEKKYKVILTNNKNFVRIKNENKINKIQKTTLWKKAYRWLDNPENLEQFSPILFFKNQDLEFLIIVNKYGIIKFINKQFHTINKFKNKNLNVLLNKTETETFKSGSQLSRLAQELL